MTNASRDRLMRIAHRKRCIKRLLLLAFQLTKTPLTQDELSKHFDVCKKTIRRDIDVLREIGVNVRGAQQSDLSVKYSVAKNFVQRILEK